MYLYMISLCMYKCFWHFICNILEMHYPSHFIFHIKVCENLTETYYSFSMFMSYFRSLYHFPKHGNTILSNSTKTTIKISPIRGSTNCMTINLSTFTSRNGGLIIYEWFIIFIKNSLIYSRIKRHCINSKYMYVNNIHTTTSRVDLISILLFQW